jgi:hypothetical protein
MSNPEFSAAGFEVDPDPPETSTLFSVIDRDKVFGLNLTVPEDAKELIKPWNDRESVDKWVDSGVDDQVRMHLLALSPAKHSHSRRVRVSSLYTYPSHKMSKYGVFY